MRLRDGIVISIAVVALVLLGAGMAASEPAPPGPSPTPAPPLPTAAPPAVLRVGVLGRAFSVDPLLATTPAERVASSLLFRGLVRLGPDGTLLPDVASSWEVSDDGLTITFHLRPDVHWNDGPLVDADDVVFTTKLLADGTVTGPRAADWSQVTVERVDRFTVRVTLPLPLAGFLARTAFPILPRHLLEDIPFASWSGLTLDTSAIGNGHFRLDRATDTELDLVTAGGPRGGAPAAWPLGQPQPESTPAPAGETMPLVDAIRLVFEPDVATMADDLRAGDLDLAAGLTPEQANELRAAAVPGTREIDYPSTTVATLVPNLRFSERPLADVAVRRALSSAIDRDAIVHDVLGGAGTPVQTLVSPAWPLWDQDASGVPTHDPDAAIAGLEAAGWEHGADGWTRPGVTGPATIQLLVPEEASDPELFAMAGSIAEDWRSIGLLVDIVQQPPERLIEFYVRPGDFDVALIRIDLGLEPDLYPLLVSTEAQVGGSNLSGYQSASLDQLLDQARLDAAPQDRATRWQVLQAALREQVPLMPIAFSDLVQVASERVSGPAARQVRGIEDLGWDVLAWRLASGPDE